MVIIPKENTDERQKNYSMVGGLPQRAEHSAADRGPLKNDSWKQSEQEMYSEKR